jgi:glycine cleavage system H protein
MNPDNLYYTKEHEWARIQDNIATVGITDHAQEALGELTFVELPKVGQELTQNRFMGSVESSKAASDVYSPVTGKVIEINESLAAQPELINQDCYGRGWFCRVQVTDKEFLEKLMDKAQYEKYLEGL